MAWAVGKTEAPPVAVRFPKAGVLATPKSSILDFPLSTCHPFGVWVQVHGNFQWMPRNVFVRGGALDHFLAIITRGRLGISPLSNVSDPRYLLMWTD